MTSRDRIIIVVVLVAAVLAGVWFVGLAPKRKQAADLSSQIDTAKQQLAQAEQSAAQARQAKARYDADYAAVATLGKAVPKSDAVPSLVYQLQTAAHDAKIDFKSLKIAGTTTQAAPTTPAAAAATANGAAASGSSSNSSGSTNNAGTANNGASSSSSSNGSTPSSSATPAPATQAATASLPPGAAVGSAGFPTMPFSFIFNGTYFDMERFLSEVQRFVRVNGERVDVHGRLLSIDGFALTAGANGFPSVRATISATAYVQSPDDTAAAAAPDASSSTSGAGSASGAPTAEAAGVTG